MTTVHRPWRLRPVLAIAAAAVLLVAGIAIALYQDKVSNTQQEREVGELAEILAASVTAALVFDDAKAAQEYLNALQVNPDLIAAAVYGQNGQRVANFSRSSVASLAQSSGAVLEGRDSDHLTIVVPVIQAGQVVGSVALRAMTQPLSHRIFRYFTIVLLGAMGALMMLVLGNSQVALNRANAELEDHARSLSHANKRLHDEMEERRKTEEALRQSQKMDAIGRLSGGIAHDFNNLLTIVRGNLQLLRRRLLGRNEDLSRYIDGAEDGLSRAAELTKQILAFSRQQSLSPRPVSLNELVARMGQILHHSVGEQIEVRQKLDAKWWTMCDANQMENVILNLAINARDAMPNGGKLSITTRDRTVEEDDGEVPPGEYIELVVRDTGEGMSEDVLDRAVDPFFTTKPVGQGTGLGLSMAFGFIRQSDGFFDIESAPGHGTAIHIMMPRHVSAAISMEA